MVPGGLPHPRASPQGQARRVALRHGQRRGARVDGPGAAVGWRPTRHCCGAGDAHKRRLSDRVPPLAQTVDVPQSRGTRRGRRLDGGQSRGDVSPRLFSAKATAAKGHMRKSRYACCTLIEWHEAVGRR